MKTAKDDPLRFYIGYAFFSLVVLSFASIPLLEWMAGDCTNKYGARHACGSEDLAVGLIVVGATVAFLAWVLYKIARGEKDHNRPIDRRFLAAAQACDAPQLEALLREGADPNARQFKSGRTAAHFAAAKGRMDILRLLVDHKASLSVPDEWGTVPLDKAIESRHLETVKGIIELQGKPANAAMGAAYDPVYKAAYAGSPEIIRYLKDKGCEIDRSSEIMDGAASKRLRRNTFSVTPLHAAAMEGHANCVRVLLELGADVKKGSVPALFWAVLRDREEAAIALLDAGSPVTPEVLEAAHGLPSGDLRERLQLTAK